MWQYDGQTFETWNELSSYVIQKFGDTASANLIKMENWGVDLAGEQVYQDHVVYAGRTQMALTRCGLGTNNALQQLVDRSNKYYEYVDGIKQAKTASTYTWDGTTYTNGALNLGTQEAEGGQVLTATRTIVTDNGTVQNQPNVMTADAVEDPTVPGTFSYLATLKALGWLPLPTWTAAAAPLLGVGLGVGLYDLNPEFWEKVSRTLLPFCYDDNGTPKMPVSVDENGNVHTPETAIEALRNLLIEEGAYGTGDYEYSIPSSEYSALNDPNMLFPYYAIPNVSYYEVAWLISGSSTLSQRIRFTTSSPVYMVVFTQSASEAAAAYPQVISKTAFTLQVSLDDYRNGSWHNGGYSARTVYSSATKDGKPFYYCDIPYATGRAYRDLKDNPYIDYSLPNACVTNRSIDMTAIKDGARIVLYGNESGGAGIEGATPESGATYPTDTTKNLAEIYPTWAGNAINVINNPTGETVEDMTEKWYPISLSNTNYTDNTEDAYSTETQTDSQTGTNTNQNQLDQIVEGLQELIETLTESGTLPPNPTIPSDPSGDTPTPIPPVITGAGSDLIAIYNPTKTQLQAFNQFLWSLDPTNLTNWKKVFVNPIEAIIALQMIYVTPITGESRNIKCGYIETDVSSKIVTNQYVDIDCGLVHLGEYFHNIWDYVATHVELYLPFIGIVPLHVGDVMESDIRVRYRVDVYTGTCLAQVIVLKGNSLATLYTYAGNCSVQLPITSAQFGALWSGLIGATASMLTAGFTGGASIPAQLAIGAGSLGNSLLNSGGMTMQRSGGIGANAGAMGIRTPYMIINRKIPLDASMYQTQYGFPANKTVVLGNMSGYTRVKDIHLAGIPCTDDELEMIERLLKDGVIIN